MKTNDDLLKMDYINSLPQPFIAHFCGGSEWQVHDIDVQTGLLRIDLYGKLQVKHIGEVMFFRGADGLEHDSDTFYSDQGTEDYSQGDPGFSLWSSLDLD